jgi:hypothetical protein
MDKRTARTSTGDPAQADQTGPQHETPPVIAIEHEVALEG